MRKNKKAKKVRVSPELADALRQQRQLFRKKFGREPGPEDPIFFDPDYHIPVPITEEKAEEKIVDVIMKLGYAKDRHEALETWRRTMQQPRKKR